MNREMSKRGRIGIKSVEWDDPSDFFFLFPLYLESFRTIPFCDADVMTCALEN